MFFSSWARSVLSQSSSGSSRPKWPVGGGLLVDRAQQVQIPDDPGGTRVESGPWPTPPRCGRPWPRWSSCLQPASCCCAICASPPRPAWS